MIAVFVFYFGLDISVSWTGSSFLSFKHTKQQPHISATPGIPRPVGIHIRMRDVRKVRTLPVPDDGFFIGVSRLSIPESIPGKGGFAHLE